MRDVSELVKKQSSSTGAGNKQLSFEEQMQQWILADFEIMKKMGRAGKSTIYPESIGPRWKN